MSQWWVNFHFYPQDEFPARLRKSNWNFYLVIMLVTGCGRATVLPIPSSSATYIFLKEVIKNMQVLLLHNTNIHNMDSMV